jgi:AcrR family transcriptional regulator
MAKSKPRIPLSRDRVLRAAVGIADEGGLESLTMRKLAQELGVEAMSLYNHVDNKDDVLDGMSDAVASEIGAPSAGADWKTAIRELATSAHETFLRHRWAVGLSTTRVKPSPARLRYGEALLEAFRSAGGFPAALTFHAYHVIESYVLGYTHMVLNYSSIPQEQVADLAGGFLRTFPAEEYPHFHEHVLQHIEPRDDHVSGFELGLELILDGLERLRDAQYSRR